MAQSDRVLTFIEDGTVLLERWVSDGHGARKLVAARRVFAADALAAQRTIDEIPPRCRFIARTGASTIYITEDAPCVRTTRWHTSGFGEPPRRWLAGRAAADTLRARGAWGARIAQRIADARITRAGRRWVRRIANVLPTLAGVASRTTWLLWHLGVILPLALVALPLRALLWVPTRSRIADDNETFDLALAFPYLVKAFVFDAGRFARLAIFYRTAPLTSPDDVLYAANLPNQVYGGYVCMPHGFADTLAGLSHARAIAEIERAFWGSTWNYDLTGDWGRSAYQHPELRSPWAWEEATRRDPTFMLDLPSEGNFTVRMILNRFLPPMHGDSATLFQMLCSRTECAAEVG